MRSHLSVTVFGIGLFLLSLASWADDSMNSPGEGSNTSPVTEAQGNPITGSTGEQAISPGHQPERS